jgi:hypothetical protein
MQLFGHRLATREVYRAVEKNNTSSNVKILFSIKLVTSVVCNNEKAI